MVYKCPQDDLTTTTQWSIWTSHPKYVCFHEKLEFKLLMVLVNYNNGIEIVYRTKFHDFLNFCIQSVKLRVLYNDLFCFFKTPFVTVFLGFLATHTLCMYGSRDRTRPFGQIKYISLLVTVCPFGHFSLH